MPWQPGGDCPTECLALSIPGQWQGGELGEMGVKDRCWCEDCSNYDSEFAECKLRAIQKSTRVESNNGKVGRVDDFGWPQSGACGMENGESDWTGLAFPTLFFISRGEGRGAEMEHRIWRCIQPLNRHYPVYNWCCVWNFLAQTSVSERYLKV